MKNRYEIRGDQTAIFLIRKGEVIETLIDTDDLVKVLSYKYTWFPYWSEHTQSYYVRGYTPEKRIALHRYIMDSPEGLMIDHIDHDTLNNRRSNLRTVTNAENGRNRKGASRNGRSRVRGVHWCEQKQAWQTRVTINGKRYFLGLYRDIESAKIAVESFREKMSQFPLTAATYI